MKEVNIENGRMVTIDIVKANIFAVVLMIVSGIALLVPYILITFASFAPSGWRSISFGIMWKMATPYCHCNEPLHPRPYIVAALMPLIVLGIIPAVICLVIGSFYLLLWSIVFIAAAGGDIWMAWLMTKESPDCTVLDHPSEAGYYVFD